jgi:phage terminase large subunit
VINLAYEPRDQFLDFHQRQQRNALMVCHRRMGKTVGCIGDLVVRALHTSKPNARFGYVAPFRQQAKEIAWTYLKNMTDGIRVEKARESELRVKLPNDAWITLYGADNPDALRGLYFDGLILDEFGDMKPSLMGEVILPCLADREGFMVLIGTAKGRNQFYDYKMKAEDPANGWFYKNQRASDTGIIPQDELDRMREVMGEAQYLQELENDFDAALPGRYYADLINTIEEKGRITDEDLYDPNQKVHVAADVGLRDSTAWWFWQPRKDGIAVIDYYENSGVHVDHYLGMLKERGYEYAEIWLPHDAKAKSLATRRSTMEQIRIPSIVRPDLYDGGFVMPVRMVPKLSIQHGIDSVRLILPKCYISTARGVSRGLDCLRSYRRQWHEHTQSFSDTPLHDWASNGADGFRYLSLVAEKSHGEFLEHPAAMGSLGLGRTGNPEGYTLDKLFEDQKSSNWRQSVLRI